ncbi:PREDICTED: putative transcription factor SPT20 homolog-like 2 [Dipodomys ordii]|uniref:Transcription factor SPT20 homolog-like 2 n=1 Tax=Dipodomys ordii TaxID=10020 RepID=A0A1S3G0U4_DIPOR|nr:PREDICTED: putative transcription factor SPT20 homolog-like 2 [Dipodomys ordii]
MHSVPVPVLPEPNGSGFRPTNYRYHTCALGRQAPPRLCGRSPTLHEIVNHPVEITQCDDFRKQGIQEVKPGNWVTVANISLLSCVTMQKHPEHASEDTKNAKTHVKKNPFKKKPLPREEKSLQEKLYDLYIEECGKKPEVKEFRSNESLLDKLLRREAFPCLVITLSPENWDFTVRIKDKDGSLSETIALTYSKETMLEYLDAEELPPFLFNILEKSEVNLSHHGCVIAEIRDYRQYSNRELSDYQSRHVLLRPARQTLVESMRMGGHWQTQEEKFEFENQLMLAKEDPLCFGPSFLGTCSTKSKLGNKQTMKNNSRKWSFLGSPWPSVNWQQELPRFTAPPELEAKISCRKRAEKRKGYPYNTTISTTAKCVDTWQQKSCDLDAPSHVDVQKYAKGKPSVPSGNSQKTDWLTPEVREMLAWKPGWELKKMPPFGKTFLPEHIQAPKKSKHDSSMSTSRIISGDSSNFIVASSESNDGRVVSTCHNSVQTNPAFLVSPKTSPKSSGSADLSHAYSEKFSLPSTNFIVANSESDDGRVVSTCHKSVQTNPAFLVSPKTSPKSSGSADLSHAYSEKFSLPSTNFIVANSESDDGRVVSTCHKSVQTNPAFLVSPKTSPKSGGSADLSHAYSEKFSLPSTSSVQRYPSPSHSERQPASLDQESSAGVGRGSQLLPDAKPPASSSKSIQTTRTSFYSSNLKASKVEDPEQKSSSLVSGSVNSVVCASDALIPGQVPPPSDSVASTVTQLRLQFIVNHSAHPVTVQIPSSPAILNPKPKIYQLLPQKQSLRPPVPQAFVEGSSSQPAPKTQPAVVITVKGLGSFLLPHATLLEQSKTGHNIILQNCQSPPPAQPQQVQNSNSLQKVLIYCPPCVLDFVLCQRSNPSQLHKIPNPPATTSLRICWESRQLLTLTFPDKRAACYLTGEITYRLAAFCQVSVFFRMLQFCAIYSSRQRRGELQNLIFKVKGGTNLTPENFYRTSNFDYDDDQPLVY